MASDKYVKLYNYIVGVIALILLLYTTLINGLNIADIPLFLILIVFNIIIDKFSINVGKLTVTFVFIIELSSFLIFGIEASAWIQVAFLFISDRIIHRKTANRVLLNMGMYVLKMFAGGYFFYAVQDWFNRTGIGSTNTRIFLCAGVFAIVSFAVNYFFITIQFAMIKRKFFWQMIFESGVWEFLSIIISIPLALAFTYVYKYSQGLNLLYAMLILMPIIFISFIFALMRKIIFGNKQLKALSKVAVTINSFLDLEKTYNSIIEAISSLVDFKGCYIFDLNENEDEMIPVAYKVEEGIPSVQYNFKLRESQIGKAALGLKPIIIDDLSKEAYKKDANGYSNIYKSCILVPMRRLNKCTGCIALFGDEQSLFSDEILEFLMILSDQATIAIENAKLYKLSEEEAITDGLTYLYNQRYFYNYLGRKIKENKGAPQKISLILFDVDHFKNINDIYGHTVGDYVLKEIAVLIKNCVRKNDIVSRYGGEEFTVILPGMDSEGAYAIAERVRRNIEDNVFEINGLSIKVTISGGVSEYPRIAANDVELVNYADRAMYLGAKFKGRNRVKVYDENMI